MSAELAMITGLALTAYLGLRIFDRFQNADSMEEEAVTVLSMLFLVGMLYTGHGIAGANSLSKAQDAYVVAALIAVLAFLALTVELVKGYWRETREDTEFGYFD